MCKKIIFSILLLFFGIFIYYLFRENILIKQNFILAFIRNYIPDILWTISFYCISTVFSKNIVKNYIVFTAIYVFSIGLFFELLQLKGIVKGTYDVFDIIIYIIAILVACLIEKNWRRNV